MSLSWPNVPAIRGLLATNSFHQAKQFPNLSLRFSTCFLRVGSAARQLNSSSSSRCCSRHDPWHPALGPALFARLKGSGCVAASASRRWHGDSQHSRSTQQQPPAAVPTASSSTTELSAGGRPKSAWRKLNPLRMLFGSAWRKAIPLSVLFFSATFIFTMVSRHCCSIGSC